VANRRPHPQIADLVTNVINADRAITTDLVTTTDHAISKVRAIVVTVHQMVLVTVPLRARVVTVVVAVVARADVTMVLRAKIVTLRMSVLTVLTVALHRIRRRLNTCHKRQCLLRVT
jgi:hypothetical protein